MKTTNSKKKFLALFLSVVLLIISIPVYAESGTENSGEHVFTFEELASMDSPQNPLLPDDGTFVPVNKVEGDTARTSGARATASTTTEYYIIEKADGYLLTSPSSGAFSRTRYSSGNGNGHTHQKWKFVSQNDNGIYVVYSTIDPTKCLTVNSVTKAVTLEKYTASQYQNWKMYYSSNGNALASAATDTGVKGNRLVIRPSSCIVSDRAYTRVGFFNVEAYVPTTGLYYSNFYLAPESGKHVSPIKSPSNAYLGGTGGWLSWSSSNTNIMIVKTNGLAKGVSAGTATLTFTDKITRASGSCTISVSLIAEGTYFLKNKQNLLYAKVKNGTMTNGQNAVQYVLDGSNEERWAFTLNNSTGYYSIKSVKSGATAYYMAVSDDASTVGKPIVIRSATESTLTDGMKWRIERTSSGAYKLCPKTGEANGYVLNTSTSATTNNNILTQDTYVQNTSYRDEWLLIRMNPTNGSELTYNQSLWGGVVGNNCNCYAYAINNQVYPNTNVLWFRQQPGEYSNQGSVVLDGYWIYSAVEKDYQKYNADHSTSLAIRPIGQYEKCPSGMYKVALVVGPTDYHWYRQDSDGLWSHKPGTTPVKRTDDSNALIIDPQYAARTTYPTFVGYYAISPWNNMYSGASSSSPNVYFGGTYLTAEQVDAIRNLIPAETSSIPVEYRNEINKIVSNQEATK